MAPLPESNTDRAFLTYRVAEQEHTMTVRYNSESASLAEVITSIDDFITAMEPLLFASSFVRFETSVNGSNVRVPQTWTGQTEWGGGPAGKLAERLQPLTTSDNCDFYQVCDLSLNFAAKSATFNFLLPPCFGVFGQRGGRGGLVNLRSGG